MEHRVLLLNASYEPLKILSWQKAICMWFDDKVEIVKEYEFSLTSASSSMLCPAVVRLKKYVSHRRDRVKFNRINLFARDNFQCQYCGESFPPKQLTYDHVHPKSQGGKTCWENIVTACYPCNSSKADRTPEQANMELLHEPVKPSWTPYVRPHLYSKNAYPSEWNEFI